MEESNASSAASVQSASSDDSVSSELDYNTGELRMLAETLGFVSDPSEGTASTETESRGSSDASREFEAVYGPPLDPDDAALVVPEGEEGLVWRSLVIPDDFISKGVLMSGLNKRDFDLDSHEIKPKRPSLPMTQSQLFSSLTKIEGSKGPRYIFNGVLNGWPGLRNFELIFLESKRSLGPLTTPNYLNKYDQTWGRYWSAKKEGVAGVSPAIKERSRIFRATLRSAPWTRSGWSPDSPGHVFWYEAQNPEPRLTYGLNMVNTVGDDKCRTVHMISHRYGVKKESPKDKLTYHSIVLLEWEHGKFCTVIEGAYLNGIGGYNGKSSWYEDRDEKVTGLFAVLPNEMIQPWLTSASEIRLFDVPSKNLEEFKEFVKKYEGSRFIDPHYTFSHPARLTYRSRSNIAQYLINYISRDGNYSEITRNCQTLAADICSFLAGKKDVVPFHPVNRIEYTNRAHLFLYESRMYVAKKKGSMRKKLFG
eukprot:scaffold16396_cov140-Cylindrotheca_fusiformis.AAC.10